MKNKESNSLFTIPIKVNSYDELFEGFDYRDICERGISESLNHYINERMLRQPYNFKNLQVQLIVYMPLEVRSVKSEDKSIEGILNSYKDFFHYEKKLTLMGIRRIIYYLISSLILLSCWYFLGKNGDKTLLTSLLNAGGTVLLWEVMSLIFIEGKNFKFKVKLNKKLINMIIKFKYI